MYTITWDDKQEQMDSVQAVENLLDRLQEYFRSRAPTLVTVERSDNGDSLSIGLGGNMSVLNYIRGDKSPPYYTSSGGHNTDEAISFLFGGEWSEYPLKNAVPLSAARAAMTQFCKTGELAKDLTWEEV